MYSNILLNFQQSMTIVNVGTKNIWNRTEYTAYITAYQYLKNNSLKSIVFVS